MRTLPVVALLLSLAILIPFSLVHAQNSRRITLTISNGPGHATDTMGLAAGATNCIDASLGESELPPTPPAGIFDARFVEPACVPAIQGLSLDLHGTNGNPDTTSTFNMSIQKDTTLPILLTLSHGWSSVFPGIEIYDGPSGGINTLDVVMAANPERDTLTLGYSVTAHGITTFHDVTSPAIIVTPLISDIYQQLPPVLQSPSNGSSNQPSSLELAWTTPDNAYKFNVLISTDSSFNPSSSFYESFTGVDSVQLRVSHLPSNATLYWEVMEAAVPENLASAWAGPWKFTTGGAPVGRDLIGVTISNGRFSVTDSMGYAPGATNCIDDSLGEIELPPVPPTSIFDARFVEPGCSPPIQGLSLDIHGSSSNGETTFNMIIQKDTSLPILLTLSPGWPYVFHSMEIYDRPSGGVNSLDVLMSPSPERDTLTLAYALTSHGTTTIHDVTEPAFLVPVPLGVASKNSNLVPARFELSQNFPNPFNPATTIGFAIERTAFTRIEVYNLLGQRIATLVSQVLTPGSYTARWNGTDDRGASVASGVYFVHMSAAAANGAPEFNQIRKLVLMK